MMERERTGQKNQIISEIHKDSQTVTNISHIITTEQVQLVSPKNTCNPDHCFYAGRTYTDILYLCDKKDFNCPPLLYAYKNQLVKCGIYERYHWATFESIQRQGIPDQQAYKTVRAYVDSLQENLKSGNGLILKGNVGTGKTSLAIAIMQHMIRNGDINCYFVPLASLLDEIFTRQGNDRAEYVDKLKNCKLLVIDDLGQEHSEGWVQLKFENIISERYNRCRSTIFTSNLTADQMKNRYTERIIDRFRDNSKIINFTGKSLRGQLRAV